MPNYGKAYKQNRRTNAKIQRDRASENARNSEVNTALSNSLQNFLGCSFAGRPATVIQGDVTHKGLPL